MVPNRPLLCMLAALALALSFGAIGCDGDAEGGEGGAGGALPGTGGDGGGGAGGEPGAGGDGGEGGSGGQGGEGGAGGAGGEGSGLCGGQECRMGEKCVEDGAVEVCRCDPDLDLCGAEMVCSPISLRCQPKPPPAVEFEPCTEPGAEAHGLECVNVQPQPLWLRPCQDTTDCALVDTFCPTEAGISSPFCSRNLCNPPTEPTHLDNGAPFGPCDASRGFLDEDTAHFGTCYPFLFSTGIQGRCERNGISTTTCKSRGSVGFADTEEICEAGMFCLETLMKGEGASCTWSTDCDPGLDCRSSTCKPKGCENDSDCGDENYCGTDKLCRALGKCETICNAGQEGKAAGEYAGCEDGQSCELFDSRMPATNPLSLGTCK